MPHEPVSRVLGPLRHPIRSLGTLSELMRYSARAARLYPAGAVRLFLRGIELVREHGFTPEEAFQLGLFDPDVPRQDLSSFATKEHTLAWQRSVNPATWAPLLRNKGIFYRYCEARSHPVPTLFAILFADGSGWIRPGRLPTSDAEWREYLEDRLPEEVVVKPCEGYHGRGVELIRRSGGTFTDGRGRVFTADTLYRRLAAGAGEAGLLIQERLQNHRELRRLSGSEHLQTVRIMTYVDREGRCDILQALLKVIVDDGVTDNYRGGRSGNLLVEICVEDGHLRGRGYSTSGTTGLVSTPAHPVTGVSFDGFPLPRWRDAVATATKAAHSFLPVRTVGWDVAITPTGAIIVEGNVWWDMPSPLPGARRIVREFVRTDASPGRG